MLIYIEMDNLKEEASVKLSNIDVLDTFINSLKIDIPNIAFRVKELEFVEETLFIKPESYKKFTIVDSNDTTIQKQINFYKLFEYIENREGMINS